MSTPLTVLVTGCSDGGIGSSVAIALANHSSPPCRVVATLRSVSKATALSNHANITVLPLDVNSFSSTQDLLKTLSEKAIQIDIIVCNAGVHYPGPILDADIDSDPAIADGQEVLAQSAFETNVWGYLRTVKALVPDMVRRKRGGLVVTVGSCAQILPSPFAGVYVASKAAMHSLAETLGLELEPFGIQTLLIKPGAILSNIATNGQHSLPRALQPDFTPTALSPASLYNPTFTPAILGRLQRSQTDPSAITSSAAASLIVSRIFEDYQPAGEPLTWMEWLRAMFIFASLPDASKMRFKGGVLLIGRLAWLFWVLDMVMPREVGLRIVARSIFGKPPKTSRKKVD